MIRPTSQLIFSLFLDQFEDFLPTYNANGEIEVWRNTLPRLIPIHNEYLITSKTQSNCENFYMLIAIIGSIY